MLGTLLLTYPIEVATLFWVFIAVFVATCLITLGGVAGWLAVPQDYLKPLFNTILIQLATLIIGSASVLFKRMFTRGDSVVFITSPFPNTSRYPMTPPAGITVSGVYLNQEYGSRLQLTAVVGKQAILSDSIQLFPPPRPNAFSGEVKLPKQISSSKMLIRAQALDADGKPQSCPTCKDSVVVYYR